MVYGCTIDLRGVVEMAAWERYIGRQFDGQRIAREHILRYHAELEIVILTVVQIDVCRVVLQLDEDIEIGVDRELPWYGRQKGLEEVVTVAKFQLNMGRRREGIDRADPILVAKSERPVVQEGGAQR